MMKRISRIWKLQLKDSNYSITLSISIINLVLVLLALTSFLQFNESRTGALLNDPFLNLFSPINLTWFTFALLYGGLIISLIYLINNPKLLVLAFLCYSILSIFRMLAMNLIPLNPPANMIALVDPFVEFFGGGETLTKDLFFSGHTSLMFLLFLIIKEKKLKKTFLYATIMVGSSVLLQHVHYTIDVFAAPFFAYVSYQLGKYILNRNVNNT